jgi:hypothetical protein
MLNSALKYEDRISYRSFQRYKHEAMAWGHANEEDDGEESEEKLERFEYDPIYVSLYRLFTMALIKQKKNLVRRMLEDDKNWRRYQWILQRKFAEWNVRYTSMEAEREQEMLTSQIGTAFCNPEPEPELDENGLENARYVIKLIPTGDDQYLIDNKDKFTDIQEIHRIREEWQRIRDEEQRKNGYNYTPPRYEKPTDSGYQGPKDASAPDEPWEPRE